MKPAKHTGPGGYSSPPEEFPLSDDDALPDEPAPFDES
jgi:hypothetical protein